MKKNKGFTLMELVIYMGLFSILLIVLAEVFTSALDDRLKSESTSQVVQNGRFILARFMYDINRAESIAAPVSLGEQTNSLQIIISGVTYTYTLNNNNLELTNNFGINKLNSGSTTISDLSFKRLGNISGKNTIQINFTLVSKTVPKSGPEIKNFQTIIGLR